MQGKDNIMVILSSPSGVGKTTITKKSDNKSINHLKFQFHTQLALQDPMKLMVWTIILFLLKNLKN